MCHLRRSAKHERPFDVWVIPPGGGKMRWAGLVLELCRRPGRPRGVISASLCRTLRDHVIAKNELLTRPPHVSFPPEEGLETLSKARVACHDDISRRPGREAARGEANHSSRQSMRVCLLAGSQNPLHSVRQIGDQPFMPLVLPASWSQTRSDARPSMPGIGFSPGV